VNDPRQEPLVLRSALRVRPAVQADLPALVALGAELREALLPADGGVRPTSPAGRSLLEQRLREAIDSDDRHLVLVVGERDEPLGMALFTVGPANALFPSPALHMTHGVVSDRHRRRGAGRALVAAAAACAEERGLDQVVVSVRAGSRDANRFFARLGFAPLAVRRTASVTTIRRALAQNEASGGARRRRPRRLGTGAIPPQPLAKVPASAGEADG
jgi:ribosomal protein S18 acetylase RimI-like enzyme